MIINVDFAQKTILSTTFTVQKPPIEAISCRHNAITVDSHSRTLVCTSCGQVLNPFDYVLSLASTEVRLFDSLNRMREERNRLYGELDRLKRQAKALKRIKTNQKPKQPEPIKNQIDGKGAIADIKNFLNDKE